MKTKLFHRIGRVAILFLVFLLLAQGASALANFTIIDKDFYLDGTRTFPVMLSSTCERTIDTGYGLATCEQSIQQYSNFSFHWIILSEYDSTRQDIRDNNNVTFEVLEANGKLGAVHNHWANNANFTNDGHLGSPSLAGFFNHEEEPTSDNASKWNLSKSHYDTTKGYNSSYIISINHFVYDAPSGSTANNLSDLGDILFSDGYTYKSQTGCGDYHAGITNTGSLCGGIYYNYWHMDDFILARERDISNNWVANMSSLPKPYGFLIGTFGYNWTEGTNAFKQYNKERMRALSYYSIIAGAKTIRFWGNKVNPGLRPDIIGLSNLTNGTKATELNNLAGELNTAEMQDILLLPMKNSSYNRVTSWDNKVNFSNNPKRTIPISFANQYDSFAYVLKQNGSTYYLIVVNKHNVSLTTDITISGLTGTLNATTVGIAGFGSAAEHRVTPLTVTDGNFTDTFDPYAAHVYEISNVTAGEGESSSTTWTISGSGGDATWSQFTHDNVTEDRGSHGVKLGLFQDNFNDNTEDWSEYTGGSGSSSNGRYYYNSSLGSFVSSNGNASWKNYTVSANVSLVTNLANTSYTGLYIHNNSAGRIGFRIDWDNNYVIADQSGDVSWQTSIPQYNRTMNLSQEYNMKIKVFGSNVSLWFDDYYMGSSIYSSSNNISGDIGVIIRAGNSYWDNFSVRELDNNGDVVTKGNLTTWHNWTDGNVTYQIVVNVTTPANTNYSIYGGQNGTALQLIASENQTGNQTIGVASDKFENYDVMIQLYGNETATPELMSITYYSQVAEEEDPSTVWTTGIGGQFFQNKSIGSNNTCINQGDGSIQVGYFCDNFNDNNSVGWNTTGGTWTTTNGLLNITSTGYNRIFYNVSSYTNISIYAKFMTNNLSSYIDVSSIRGNRTRGGEYQFSVGGSPINRTYLFRYNESNWENINVTATQNRVINQWNYSILKMYGSTLEGYLGSSYTNALLYIQTSGVHTQYPNGSAIVVGANSVSGGIVSWDEIRAVELDAQGNQYLQGNYSMNYTVPASQYAKNITVNGSYPSGTNYSVKYRQNATGNYISVGGVQNSTVVSQENSDVNNTFQYGQTFTTGSNQIDISNISVWIDNSGYTQTWYNLSVWDVPEKTNYIGSKNITFLTTEYQWTGFTFDTPLTVSPSTQYYFEITKGSDGSYGHSYTSWDSYSGGDYYRLGTLVFESDIKFRIHDSNSIRVLELPTPYYQNVDIMLEMNASTSDTLWINTISVGTSQTAGDGINNTPTISFVDPTPANNSVNTTRSVFINTTSYDADNNNMTALLNWNNSLVGWWRMNEAAGGTLVQDFSGYGNNGTWYGNTTSNVTTGRFGNALSFDGVDDYVNVGNDTSLSISNNITVSTWIYKTNNSNFAPIITKSSGTTGYYLMNDALTIQKVIFVVKIGGVSRTAYTPTATFLNNWNHVVGVYNGTRVLIYLNGVLSATGTDITGNIDTNIWSVRIGPYNGSIDEVRIYNRALSAEEINASYNAGTYRLQANFTNLPNGIYNYTAYVQDSTGAVNQTETRYLTVDPPYTPPVPVISSVMTGNFYVNTTWTAGSGNKTDSYNSTNGTTWINSTLPYRNTTLSPHAWQNLTIYAYNSSYTGTLSLTALTNNTQIPNNIPEMDLIGNKEVTEGQWLNFSITGTDADSDSLSCSSNNTKGTIASCNFNWSTGHADIGTYNWIFYLNDSYGGSDSETITITVNADLTPPASITGLTNSTGNFYHNWTWTNPSDSDFSHTMIYINGAFAANISSMYYNLTASVRDQSTISTRTVDTYGNINTTWVNHTSIIANNAISISGISDTYNINAGNTLNIDADYSDADGDTGTFARNFSTGTFSTTTGVLSWATGVGDVGTYNWQINVSDGYGSVATKEFTVTVSAAGGSGTDWDWSTFNVYTINGTGINNAMISTSVGNFYTNEYGTVNTGYMFEHGLTYWINVSKSGYQSNNTQLTFNEDHENYTIYLTESAPVLSIINNSKTNDAATTKIFLDNAESITFFASSNHPITTWNWSVDSVIQSNNYDNLTTSWSTGKYHYVSLSGVNTYGTSNTLTWGVNVFPAMATATIGALNETPADAIRDALKDKDAPALVMATVLPFTNLLGAFFYAIVWFMVFVMLWIKQKSMNVPMIIGIIFGGLIISFLPEQYQLVTTALIVLGIFGIIYIFFKGRG